MSKQEFHFWCWQNSGVPVSVIADNPEDAKHKIQRMFADGKLKADFNDCEGPGFAQGFYIVSSNPPTKRQFAVKVQVTGVNTFLVEAEDEDEARQIIENDIKQGSIDESSLTQYGDITIESCVKTTEKENKEA